jgi:hypothetical protein
MEAGDGEECASCRAREDSMDNMTKQKFQINTTCGHRL